MSGTTSSSIGLNAHEAFAAVAMAAVCWDGVLSMAGSRSLRHALDYRSPFRDYSDQQMLELLDGLLQQLRDKGAQHLMVDAAAALSSQQRDTAFAVAAELMRSDGVLNEDEQNILNNLAVVLGLEATLTSSILAVMDVLHSALDG